MKFEVGRCYCKICIDHYGFRLGAHTNKYYEGFKNGQHTGCENNGDLHVANEKSGYHSFHGGKYKRVNSMDNVLQGQDTGQMRCPSCTVFAQYQCG